MTGWCRGQPPILVTLPVSPASPFRSWWWWWWSWWWWWWWWGLSIRENVCPDASSKFWRFAEFTKYFFKNIMKRRRSRAFQRWITLYSQKCVKRNVWRKICGENIPRIGKLPYGAKWGFIERKALLKERVNGNKFQNLVKIPKFGPNFEIWLKFWNCEVMPKLWRYAKIVKSGKKFEIPVQSLKVLSKFWKFMVGLVNQVGG